MTPEEAHQSAPQGTRPGRLPGPEHAVDVLAKGLAGEGLSRGQALRMVGAALAGAALAVFVPGVARALQDGPVNHGPNGPVDHGPNGPVNHGPQGAVDGKASATCPFKECNRDADCPSGCPCSFWTLGGAAYFICGTQGRG
jgi:hypothetical protein